MGTGDRGGGVTEGCLVSLEGLISQWVLRGPGKDRGRGYTRGPLWPSIFAVRWI